MCPLRKEKKGVLNSFQVWRRATSHADDEYTAAAKLIDIHSLWVFASKNGHILPIMGL